jgi:SAM-dependent methyltransferase
MTSDEEADVPYGEDFHDESVAAGWAEGVMRRRPWRTTIFDHFVQAVQSADVHAARILELGSGPGFLAEQLLDRCPSIAHYTLLDFSEAMLDQSRQRLERHATRTQFLQADFKSETWPAQVSGPFDFVVSLQSVHELRHKRHAPRLYSQVSSVLAPVAELIICDHLPEAAHTPRHRVLYMSIAEYLALFSDAGYADARVAWSAHNMALYRARRATSR